MTKINPFDVEFSVNDVKSIMGTLIESNARYTTSQVIDIVAAIYPSFRATFTADDKITGTFSDFDEWVEFTTKYIETTWSQYTIINLNTEKNRRMLRDFINNVDSSAYQIIFARSNMILITSANDELLLYKLGLSDESDS